jgi:hypothetical protein
MPEKNLTAIQVRSIVRKIYKITTDAESRTQSGALPGVYVEEIKELCIKILGMRNEPLR